MELRLPLNRACGPHETCDRNAALEPAGPDAARTDAVRVAQAYGVAHGYGKEAATVQERCLPGRKREAEAAVWAAFSELMPLRGPEGYVRERTEAFREAGVTLLNVRPAGSGPARPTSTVNN